MIMTTPWGFQSTAARLVSLAIEGPDVPTRIRWTLKIRCALRVERRSGPLKLALQLTRLASP
jgi:hypothetical protein